VFAGENPVGREKEGGAVERAGVALDHADDQPDSVGARRFGEAGGIAGRNFEAAFEVTTEKFAAFGRAVAHARAEVFPLGISADKGLRENNESGTASSSFGDKCLGFGDGGFTVVEDRSGLNDGYWHEHEFLGW